jgi:hypothetical protein
MDKFSFVDTTPTSDVNASEETLDIEATLKSYDSGWGGSAVCVIAWVYLISSSCMYTSAPMIYRLIADNVAFLDLGHHSSAVQYVYLMLTVLLSWVSIT